MKRKLIIACELIAAVLLLSYIGFAIRANNVSVTEKAETQSQGPTKEEKLRAVADEYMSGVSREDIENDMNWLTKEIGVRSWREDPKSEVSEKIYKRLLDNGFTKENCRVQEFKRSDVVKNKTLIGKNVFAIIPTKEESPDILLIMAHYDTVKDTTGAVDNASGTATLFELARRFLKADRDFGMEIRFLFSQGEEEGYCGAFAYCEGLSGEEKARHKFVFNFDMTAKPTKPEDKYFLCVSTEPISSKWYDPPNACANEGSIAVDKVKIQLGAMGEKGFYSPVRAGKHDIVAFRKQGIDALTVSWRCKDKETANGSDFKLAVPKNNHKKEDCLENTDMDSLYMTTKLMTGSVARYLFSRQDV